MSEANLSHQIDNQLPSRLVTFLRTAGEIAESQGQRLYLVGGTVRDLLLGRTNLDIDVTVEGDAISLAQKLVYITQGTLKTHQRFNTATIQWGEWSIDLATTRSEAYDKPGALPRVRPGVLASDLFRRDFTINAMAVTLTPAQYGQLVDLYGGQQDLDDRLIRVLHDKSFVDDATRIWRAIRYEQRLDFQIEVGTLALLKRDLPMLDTISGDRTRHELELIMREEYPEKALCRASELGVLEKVHPALKADERLARWFDRARQTSHPEPPPVALYFSLLCYFLTVEESKEVAAKLRLPRLLIQAILDVSVLRSRSEALEASDTRASIIYHLFHDCSPVAITAVIIASESAAVRHHAQNFLSKLRNVRTSLTGNDLKEMGVPPGPRMKEFLDLLLDARLEGRVRSRRGEETLVRQLMSGKT